MSRIGYFLFFICFANITFAGQILTLKPYETVNAKIGFNELNRIAIKDGRISDVISNSDVNFQYDDEAGQLFIQPLVKGNVTVSIKTESGIYQDIYFTVLEIPSQTILFTGDIGKVDDEIVLFEQERSYVDLISQMIRAMASGENHHGWSNRECHDDLSKWSGMPLTRIGFWKGHRFDGEILKLSNHTQSAKYLTEKNFHDSNYIVAIGLSATYLKPDESLFVYRVIKDDKF